MPTKTLTPFTYYAFRFDYENIIDRNSVINFIQQECPKYAVFDEVSTVVGKRHIQGKIGKCLSQVQLRKHFKSKFDGLFNKSNYSLAIIKDVGLYDSYICKEGQPLCNNVFPQSYIDEQVAKREQNIKSFVTKNIKNSAKSFTETVALEFIDDAPYSYQVITCENIPDMLYSKEEYTEAKIKLVEYILKRLGKVAKVFDDNILQRMYNGIINYLILNSPYNDGKVYCKNIAQRLKL